MNMSIINLFVFCMTLFLISFVFNVAEMATERVDLQNTVDEAAISAATVRARGLNAVTAINHLIGELMALVILHEAIGGERTHVVNGKHPLPPRLTKTLNDDLTAARLKTKSADPEIFKLVRQKKGFQADRAILRSKRDAKQALTRIYIWMSIAEKIPKIGPALVVALQIWERQISVEYTILNHLEEFAALTYPARKIVEKSMIPNLKQIQRRTIAQIPGLASESAIKIGKRQAVTVWIDRSDLELPVELDPNANRTIPKPIPALIPVRKRPKGSSIPIKTKDSEAIRNQIVKTTQLARATYPWVLHHRKTLLSYAWILWNSNFEENYEVASYRVTVDLLDSLQQKSPQSYALYVLKDYPTPNKGYAIWNEHGADRWFTVTCFGSRTAPRQLGARLLGYQPKTSIAIAQAMTYNANEQRRMDAMISLYRRPVRFRLQAPIGWDTLNFKKRMSEVVNDPKSDRYPDVKLNWQSKLVPIASKVVRDKLDKPRLLPANIHNHLRRYRIENGQISIR